MHFLLYISIAAVSFGAGIFFGGKEETEITALETDIKSDVATSKADLQSYVSTLEKAVLKDRVALAADVAAVISAIKSKL
jgi:hypothetical protein